jgi:hypothetical protein
MDEVQSKRLFHEAGPSEETDQTHLEVSERVIRLLIMTAFISVLAFEAWLLSQVWQLF